MACFNADTISIPEARDRIYQLINDYEMPQEVYDKLTAIADGMYRKFNGRKAPRFSRHMTRDIGDQVRLYAAEYPERAQQQIAEQFGINAGRVSEALAGEKW
jgi:hypothetical protein